MSNKNIKFPVNMKCMFGDYFEINPINNQVEVLASNEMAFFHSR